MKVLVSDKLSDAGLKVLRGIPGLEVEYKTGMNEEQLCAVIGDYHGLIIRSATTVTPKVIAAADNLRVVKDCNLDGASFRGASVKSATLRETSMRGAVFAEADVSGSDFSGSDLTGASFFRATAREARFIRSRLDGGTLTSCNLMSALLSKASLQDAVLDGANLFRADLARFRGRPARLEDAFVLQARVIAPRGPE